MVDLRQQVPEGRYGRTGGRTAAGGRRTGGRLADGGSGSGNRTETPARDRSGAASGTGSADARTDRRLKITGGVLGVLMLALIGWIGGSYISGQDVSGELIKWKVVSDSKVEAHLEVRKDAGAEGVCTLRAQAESGSEVGRKSVEFAADSSRIDKVITVRTTSRATSAELVSCQKK